MRQNRRYGGSSYTGSFIKFLMMTMLAMNLTPFFAKNVSAQNALTVTGKVLNEGGDPLEGATVQEKGTNGGARTKGDGSFSLRVSGPDAVLVISYIGFFQQEMSVGGRSS